MSRCPSLWSVVGDLLPAHSLSPFDASLEISCDASLTGWGCWTSSGKEAFGASSSSEEGLHINVFECNSVLFGFQCFFRTTYDCNISVRSNSSTVVAYINNNKQGGTVSPQVCDLTLELWEFCIQWRWVIQAFHLSGMSNTRADRLSHMEHSDHSYFFTQFYFDKIFERLPFVLTVDCFVSRLNYKISNFISHYCDPLSSWVDAFSVT